MAWLVLGNAAACELGHDCHEIGCADHVSVRVTARDHPWPEGEYQLEVAFGELEGTCEFTLPDELPPRGAVTSIDCVDGVEVGIQQLYECSTQREGDAVSQSCQPIPERYEVTLGAYATPEHLSLTLRHNGSLLLDESRDVSYAVTRPNGPQCEPECRQATVELSFQ